MSSANDELSCRVLISNLQMPRFWIAHNNHLLTSAEQTARLESLRAAYVHDSAVLDTLERTNVYNDAFCIGHDGVFGTINGLRLGRVSGGHVRFILRSHTSHLILTFEHRLNGARSMRLGGKRCYSCTPSPAS